MGRRGRISKRGKTMKRRPKVSRLRGSLKPLEIQVDPLESRTMLCSGDLVLDINEDSASAFNSLRASTALGSAIYFAANDGVHGSEVWTSRGSAGSTTRLTDINRRCTPMQRLKRSESRRAC
jgi:ELWxxDGT repeat protein